VSRGGEFWEMLDHIVGNGHRSLITTVDNYLHDPALWACCPWDASRSAIAAAARISLATVDRHARGAGVSALTRLILNAGSAPQPHGIASRLPEPPDHQVGWAPPIEQVTIMLRREDRGLPPEEAVSLPCWPTAVAAAFYSRLDELR